MYKEKIRKEYNRCKGGVITFSILLAVAVVLVIVSIISYISSLIDISILANENLISDAQYVKEVAKIVITFVVLVVFECLAICTFIPFLIINAIKMGKRKRKLSLPDVEVI